MKMEAVMEIGEDYSTSDGWDCEPDISQLCRICANPNEYLIPIFQGEGLEHELKSKISKHLPIEVSEGDKLPTHLCYQCASTLIAWHDLVAACIEAEEKLKGLIIKEDKQSIVEINAEVIKDSCYSESNAETQPVDVPSCYSESNAGTQSVDVPEQLEAITSPDDKNVILTEQILESLPKEPGEIIIEEVTSMESQPIEEFSSESRCWAPFNAYHQTQTALRTLEWVSSGCVFCILCGKMKQNHTMLIKHLSVEHTIRCGHCRACFANEDQLAAHMSLHDSKGRKVHCSKVEMEKNNVIYENSPQKILNSQLQCQINYVKKKPCNQKVSKIVPSKCPFQCEICLALFSRRFDLKRHKLKHHSVEQLSGKENSNILSDSCEVGLAKPEDGGDNDCNIQDMDRRSDIEGDTQYSDDSVNSEDISRHLDVKTEMIGVLDQNYSCSLCDLSCRTKPEILIHQRKEHAVQQQRKGLKSSVQKGVLNKQFSCSLCTNFYSRSSDLQKHICKKHGGDKVVKRCVDSVDDMDVKIINQARQDIDGIIVYRCNFCDKNMRTRRGFVRHVRIHTNERPFTCHKCGKQYRSNADLTRHLRCVHDGVKNYQCDICGRYFASKGTRNDHRRTHTGEKPYVCHVCGKSFPTPNSIYIHRRIHTDYFPHSCSTCAKKFRRKQQLMNHLRTHTGEKPHGCDVCGKCFCTRDEVSRHRLTHSNDKPHICSACGIRFGQKRYLSNHMKTNHLT